MTHSSAHDPKADLHRYLRDARETLLWKLDGLSEYDVRRPVTPTGTNLLGLVKHLTGAEAMYFGATFGRPFYGPPLWIVGDAEPDADFWATPEESRRQITDGYRTAWTHADATVDALELDSVGRVPWGSRSELTLQQVLLHMVAETGRHLGHADIVRELVDGAAGQYRDGSNLPPGDRERLAAHHARVERAARTAADRERL